MENAETDLMADATLICVCPGNIIQTGVILPGSTNFILGCSLDDNGDEAVCNFVGGTTQLLIPCRIGGSAKVEIHDISCPQNGDNVSKVNTHACFAFSQILTLTVVCLLFIGNLVRFQGLH